MINLKGKIFKAVENNRLKLIEWKRKWYNYIISIQELTISRNNKDWFIIDVLDMNEKFLERIDLNVKLVFEFWGVHNKLFLL